MRESERNPSVDLARGVASLIMIQGHAYDGWVAPLHKETQAYLFTRLLGTLPLPAFLVLSGAAVALRVDAAARRGETALAVRRALCRRGLQVVAWGYVVNAVYGLMDGGQGLRTWLRADVLHAIGLSIVVLACMGVRSAASGDAPAPGPPDRGVLQRAALGVGPVAMLACPVLTHWTRLASGTFWAYLLAPFGEVPDITRMPLVPLVAWSCTGVLATLWMLQRQRGSATRHGALALLAGTGLLIAAVGAWATDALLAALGGHLSRAHAAVIPNVLDGAGRGLFVLGAGALVASWAPAAARSGLALLGRHSLTAYVFHIPFCYGRLGMPWRGRLDMPAATLGVLVLMGACVALAWLDAQRPATAVVGRLRRHAAAIRG